MITEKNSNSGYIALTSALIIAAAIVIIFGTMSLASFFNRVNISATHFKEKSRALSEACVDTAFLKLVENSSYIGDETINVASDTCRILPIVSNSSGRIISTQASFQNSFTNLKVTVATSSFSVVSWEEVQNF